MAHTRSASAHRRSASAYTRKARRHTPVRHQGTRKHHLPMHASTMKGIHHWPDHESRAFMIRLHSARYDIEQNWHTRMFEKLGWMVLAKEKGYGYKIDTYKKSIDHLLKTIDHVSAEYVNQNRKHDLNVLRMNVECLQAFVEKHL